MGGGRCNVTTVKKSDEATTLASFYKDPISRLGSLGSPVVAHLATQLEAPGSIPGPPEKTFHLRLPSYKAVIGTV